MVIVSAVIVDDASFVSSPNTRTSYLTEASNQRLSQSLESTFLHETTIGTDYESVTSSAMPRTTVLITMS